MAGFIPISNFGLIKALILPFLGAVVTQELGCSEQTPAIYGLI